MKYWPGGSYLVLNSTPSVPGDISLEDIGYKYNFWKVLGFIVTERTGGTDPGDPYLSCFPYIFYIVSVRHDFCPRIIVRSYNAYNSIDQHSKMHKYGLTLDKYWMTQSGYFRIGTTVALGVGITNAKLLFCCGVSEENRDKEMIMKK